MPPVGTALQCYSCKAQRSNEDCLHVQNCSLSETYCWTERISEWPSAPSPAHGPPRAPQAGHGPACPCAVPLDSLHLPAVGRDSKNPGLGLHHGTELRVLCPPVPLPTYASIHTQVSVLSRPSLRPPHSSLSRPGIPASILRPFVVHAFIHLPPRPLLTHPSSRPFATPIHNSPIHYSLISPFVRPSAVHPSSPHPSIPALTRSWHTPRSRQVRLPEARGHGWPRPRTACSLAAGPGCRSLS